MVPRPYRPLSMPTCHPQIPSAGDPGCADSSFVEWIDAIPSIDDLPSSTADIELAILESLWDN